MRMKFTKSFRALEFIICRRIFINKLTKQYEVDIINWKFGLKFCIKLRWFFNKEKFIIVELLLMQML